MVYLTEKGESVLGDFVNTLFITEIGDVNYMRVFLENFINGFNASFKPNKNETRAMGVTTDQFKGYDANDYMLWDISKGGSTGIEYDVYQSDAAIMPASKIAGDSVTSLYYSILPTIILDDSLKEDNSRLPKWDDLYEYTPTMLICVKNKYHRHPN